MPETQASRAVPGILAEIVAGKRIEIERMAARRADIERGASAAPPARDFATALRGGAHVRLIAECKRRSPGAGPIREGLDPADLTRSYERAGAAALSVLTDATWFGGSLDDLAAARGATTVPILRKDFTLEPLQVAEARAAGADAVLLIVRILDDARLRALLQEARALGMAALVETHDRDELLRALDAGAEIVGINNRDLDTFTTDLDTTRGLLDAVPDDVLVVSESGIRGPDDVRSLGSAGVDAVLVGETLLRADDPAVAASALVGLPRTGSARG